MMAHIPPRHTHTHVFVVQAVLAHAKRLQTHVEGPIKSAINTMWLVGKRGFAYLRPGEALTRQSADLATSPQHVMQHSLLLFHFRRFNILMSVRAARKGKTKWKRLQKLQR